MSIIVPDKLDSLIGSGGAVPTAIFDGANLDAFSRLRASNPSSLFSVQCQYNEAPLVMESGTTGTGVAPVHSINDRMVKLRATSGTGTSYIQSFQYVPYQPGKSHLICITGVLGAGVAGATVDVGYFDADNGIFLRQNGTSGLQIVRRTKTSGSVVEEVVSKVNWNINPSIQFDESKSFILIIDLQYLGMGRVRCGFDADGEVKYFHEFLNANAMAVPYMQTATLPVQMLLTATATALAKDCYFKCAAVSSEGGLAVFEDFSFSFATPDLSVTAGSGARTHLVSLRPKTTFNSITNRETLFIESIDMIVTGNNPVFWELCIGQAITGAAWANVNTASSAFEYGTGTISGSPTAVISSGYVAATAGSKSDVSKTLSVKYPVTLDRSGAVRINGTLSLVVTGLGGTSATRGVINYKEIR
jgi:hypothetical protein